MGIFEQITNLIREGDKEKILKKSGVELTEAEIQKRLTRLGDLDKIAEKIEFPFKPNLSNRKPSEVIEALACLVIKLERDLSTYDTILSDDVSGRLPSLFLRELINRIRSKAGKEPVKTYFLAAGRYWWLIEKDKAIRNFLVGKKKEIGKALVVTEYIESGHGITRLMELLKELGINFDVAAVSADSNSADYIQKFGNIFKKVRYGKECSRIGLSFHSARERYSGVRKHPESISAHPEAVSLEDRSSLVRAREDANFLAEEFFNKLLD
ncbi:MAG: hypothetical protein ACP5IX_02080 [Patescibacteria group bacterium]